MTKFQKTLLTIVTLVGLPTCVFAIEDGTYSGRYTGYLTKTTSGIATLSNTGNTITSLDIQEGTVSISAAGNLNSTTSVVGFSSAGGTLAMTGSVDTVVACTLGVDGIISVDDTYTGQLGVLTEAHTLTKSGTGTLVVGSGIDNSASPSTIAVTQGTLSVLETDNFPAAVTVASGATLETTGTIDTLDNNRTVTFASGSTLRLGGDWAAAITVAPPLGGGIGGGG